MTTNVIITDEGLKIVSPISHLNHLNISAITNVLDLNLNDNWIIVKDERSCNVDGVCLSGTLEIKR